jgi:formylmethanofuran dehydrogenase subunit E
MMGAEPRLTRRSESSAWPEGLVRVVAQLRPLHRRLCPKQVLGARIGLIAGDLFQIALPRQDRRLLAIVELDGCFADGVAEATGCRVGRRTLRVVDHGKVAATFVDTSMGTAIRVLPRVDARHRAWTYAPGATNRWRAQLEGYAAMPAAELLRWSAVELALPHEAALAYPTAHVDCSVCGEEIMNGREVIVQGSPVCRSCAGNSYVRPVDGSAPYATGEP